MKLMKKFKIGMISGLCTTALMASTVLATSCSTTTTNKTDKKVGLTNSPDNSVYHTITFKANDATETLTGKLVVQARDGNKWSSVKKPVATKADCTFKYWQYKNASSAWVELKDGDQIKSDLAVYPYFEPIVHQCFVVGGNTALTATVDAEGADNNPWRLIDDKGVEIAGDASNPVTFAFVKEESSPALPNWLGIHDGTSETTKGQIYWPVAEKTVTELTAPVTFRVQATYQTKTYTSDIITLTTVTPEPEPIIIEGDDVVNASDPDVVFEAYNYPHTDPEADPIEGLTWSVASWTNDPEAPGEAQPIFDTENEGKLITTYDCWGTGTIKATDEESNVVATMPITVHPPFVDSDGYWGIFGTPGNEIWGEYDIDTLAPEVAQEIPVVEPTTPIEYTLLGETEPEEPIAREDFNGPVGIGSNVAYIPDNFLRNCTGIDVLSIEFPSDSQCVMIGDSFMYGCTSMNGYVHLPNKLIRIGDEFMKGCSAFGSGSGSDLTIPDSLEEIGDDFLYECKAFDQDLTISANVTSVGNEFMLGCDAMVSTLTIYADYLAFKADGGMPMSFATYTEHPAWETEGFKVSGVEANINGLIGNFGPIVFSPSTNCMRKLVYVAPAP